MKKLPCTGYSDAQKVFIVFRCSGGFTRCLETKLLARTLEDHCFRQAMFTTFAEILDVVSYASVCCSSVYFVCVVVLVVYSWAKVQGLLKPKITLVGSKQVNFLLFPSY